MKSYDYVSVNQGNDQVQFRNMDSYYKRGIPYHGEVGTGENIFRPKLPEVQHDYLHVAPFMAVT